MPITRVPAVIAVKSLAKMETVPPVPPTLIVLLPFCCSDTVPTPALTKPAKLTSLVDMVIDAFVALIVEPATLVTLPVPLVVIVTPDMPVAF